MYILNTIKDRLFILATDQIKIEWLLKANYSGGLNDKDKKKAI